MRNSVKFILLYTCVVTMLLAEFEVLHAEENIIYKKSELNNQIQLANKGDTKSQSILANMYFEGRGPDRDYDQAFRWASLAAQSGDVDSQILLGNLFTDGKGTPIDDKQAFVWFQKAAQSGNPNAQFNLGLIYHSGKGVQKDFREAIKYYTLSAQQGHSRSQVKLASIYSEYQGLPVNYGEAFRLYKLAADQNEASAQLGLAQLYWNGTGVEKDPLTAVSWITLAAENGSEKAIDLKKVWTEQMTSTQIERAIQKAKYIKDPSKVETTELPESLIKKLQSKEAIEGFKDYLTYNKNSAFAISTSGAWGWVSKKTTPEVAKQGALEKCYKYSNGSSSCEVISINGSLNP
jgi:TPR repeat protein